MGEVWRAYDTDTNPVVALGDLLARLDPSRIGGASSFTGGARWLT
jgi:hypothetical protein